LFDISEILIKEIVRPIASNSIPDYERTIDLMKNRVAKIFENALNNPRKIIEDSIDTPSLTRAYFKTQPQDSRETSSFERNDNDNRIEEVIKDNPNSEPININIEYTVEDFYADLEGMMRSMQEGFSKPIDPAILEQASIDAHPLVKAFTIPPMSGVANFFFEKYGLHKGLSKFLRFTAVNYFTGENQDLLIANGLARKSDGQIFVGQDFLAHLLSFKLDVNQKNIPEEAIRTFLRF
jgi:hypothetical protein